MATWKDKNGKEWNCEITVKVLKQIKQRLNVDFMDITNAVKKLMTDVYFLCDSLYIVHEEECQRNGLSDEDFGALLVGETIDNATKALIDSLICFFPTQQREMLEKITKKREAVTAEIYRQMGTEIDNLPMEKVIELIRKNFGGASSN